MTENFEQIEKVSGTLKLAGDKSLSHRAIMFSALAKGESHISNCLNSEDINATLDCFKQMGCNISVHRGNVKVIGVNDCIDVSFPGFLKILRKITK